MVIGFGDFDDTFRALDLLQRRMDRVLYDWRAAPPLERVRRQKSPWPLVNAFETKESFVYKAEVPGLAQGDVSVTVEDEALVLRGERKADIPDGYEIRLRERPPVAFTRKLALAGKVDSDAVTAELKDGILTVTLPKAKETLPRQIAVKAL
ncbi:MAG TPA: Hsp20/alpha crystallin family protein [Polyangiaceae bacterium]|nr:Hsp20/alpha crystallin family protein [Polyangiaceae bacterium]